MRRRPSKHVRRVRTKCGKRRVVVNRKIKKKVVVRRGRVNTGLFIPGYKRRYLPDRPEIPMEPFEMPSLARRSSELPVDLTGPVPTLKEYLSPLISERTELSRELRSLRGGPNEQSEVLRKQINKVSSKIDDVSAKYNSALEELNRKYKDSPLRQQYKEKKAMSEMLSN